eukprot:4804447-Amphidinium_carterae.1
MAEPSQFELFYTQLGNLVRRSCVATAAKYAGTTGTLGLVIWSRLALPRVHFKQYQAKRLHNYFNRMLI